MSEPKNSVPWFWVCILIVIPGSAIGAFHFNELVGNPHVIKIGVFLGKYAPILIMTIFPTGFILHHRRMLTVVLVYLLAIAVGIAAMYLPWAFHTAHKKFSIVLAHWLSVTLPMLIPLFWIRKKTK